MEPEPPAPALPPASPLLPAPPPASPLPPAALPPAPVLPPEALPPVLPPLPASPVLPPVARQLEPPRPPVDLPVSTGGFGAAPGELSEHAVRVKRATRASFLMRGRLLLLAHRQRRKSTARTGSSSRDRFCRRRATARPAASIPERG